jgi:hypothetical protein
MKLIILLVFLTMTSFAQASLCESKALEYGFTSSAAQELCLYSDSAAPAECANFAYNHGFHNRTVELCQCARSIRPAVCAERAYNAGYTTSAIERCIPKDCSF